MYSDVWTADEAATYDADVAEMFQPETLGPVVDFLAALAAGRRALEFAIGSGRVALAMAECGVEVAGIELSQPMIDVMRAKPGSDQISVVRGDMAHTRVDGAFGLVYLVFNTITNLLTQDAQMACFENAAAHLEPGGCFVIETFVPALQRLPVGERTATFVCTPERRHAGAPNTAATPAAVAKRSRPEGVGGASRQFGSDGSSAHALRSLLQLRCQRASRAPA